MILLVEPRSDVARSVGAALDAGGHRCASVVNEAVAHEVLRAETVELIIVDLEPLAADLDAAVAMVARFHDQSPNLQVLIALGNRLASRATEVRARTGAFACVPHLTPTGDLVVLVERALERLKLHWELAACEMARTLLGLQANAELVPRALALARLFFDAETAILAEAEGAQGLRFRHADASHAEHTPWLEEVARRALAERAAAAGDAESRVREGQREGEPEVGQKAGSFLCLPLIARNEPLGALVVFRDHGQRRFRLADADRYGSFAAQLSLALDNARLLRKLRDEMEVRQKTEMDLRRAQRLEAIGALAAGVAHEINTPTQFVQDNVTFLGESFANMMAVVVAARTLVERSPSPSRSRPEEELRVALQKLPFDYLEAQLPAAVSESLEGLTRIGKIIAAMKAFARPSSGAHEALDVPAALDAVIVIARGEWKHVAEVETSYAPNLPPVPGLRDELHHVFLSLIVSASRAVAEIARARPKGLGKIRVSARLDAQDESTCVIEIGDDGTPVPEAVRARLFDPFFTERSEGRGQGLVIAHHLVVERHRGRIAVRSNDTEGTIFEVRLPIARAESPGQ